MPIMVHTAVAAMVVKHADANLPRKPTMNPGGCLAMLSVSPSVRPAQKT